MSLSLRAVAVKRSILAAVGTVLLGACAAPDPKLKPVRNFDAKRYQGVWHEIARLDHRFERGLDRVTALYEQRPDGKISVTNKERDKSSDTWKTARGVAKFAGDETIGALKVSFFRPFYGDYIILELDRDYSHALICGGNTSYLWILARTPGLDPKTLSALIEKAKSLGFDTDSLIFPEQ